LERACASGSISVVERDVRGFERQGAKQSKRLPRFPTARKRTVEPLGPKPATCRQARSRWRPDDREVVRHRSSTNGGNAAFRGGSGGRALTGLPTVSGGQSPKRVFWQRVLVTRTSVVEMDSKHLDGVSKTSREADRGAASSDGKGHRPVTRTLVFSLRRRVFLASRWSKERRGPLGCGARRNVGPPIERGVSRSSQRFERRKAERSAFTCVARGGPGDRVAREDREASRIESVEGAWDREPASAKPARRNPGSRLCNAGETV
jgi:hypothetical protein